MNFAPAHPAYAYGAPYGGHLAPRYDIVGAEGDSIVDKTKAFLAEAPLGVKNGYLLGGAAAIGAAYLAYSAGLFGKRRGRGRKR